MHALSRNGGIAALTLCVLGLHSGAQPCSPAWLNGQSIAGAFDSAGPSSVDSSVMWDPDGAGPLSTVLVVGGRFSVMSGVFANRVAAWDGSHWSPLGLGPVGGDASIGVRALAVLPSGELVAAGSFATADDLPTPGIAKWNGTAWSPLGTGIEQSPGVPGHVTTLVTLSNGDLVAAGSFQRAGGTQARSVARWSGGTWSAMGSGVVGTVEAAISLPNGDLLIGGVFSVNGGPAQVGVARWDGASWTSVGSPGLASVRALAADFFGALYAGGSGGIARWNGTAWDTIGHTPGQHSVNTLVVTAEGLLVAGGDFMQIDGEPLDGLGAFDGSAWMPVADWQATSGQNSVRVLRSMGDGRLLIGGTFTNPSNTGASGLAVWSDAGWSTLCEACEGVVGSIDTVTPDAIGSGFIAGGTFEVAGTASAANIARWDGAAWRPLGPGVSGLAQGFPYTQTSVRATLVMPDSSVIAGGNFTHAGDRDARCIARWDGTAWEPLGSSVSGGGVYALLRESSGTVIVGGNFTSAGGAPAGGIATWDGDSWSAVGQGVSGGSNTLLGGTVFAMALLANGDLIVGGNFSVAGQSDAMNIARWNGSSWSALDMGQNVRIESVLDLLTLPTGELVVAGDIVDLETGDHRGIVTWDGIAWSFPVGTGIVPRSVSSLALSPLHELCAVGAFSGLGENGNLRIAAWNGTAWVQLAQATAGEEIRHLAFSANGELIAAGPFSRLGGSAANGWARWSREGTPTVALQPQPTTIVHGANSVFEVRPGTGYETAGPLMFEWRHDGPPVHDGSGGASPEGGVVTGSTGPRLTITSAQPADAGTYTCVISNECGSAQAAPALLAIRCGPPDMNADGFFDAVDIDLFFRAFNSLDTLADFNSDGFVDAIDLDQFIVAWASGC